jgi:hypothetical protein
MASSHAGPAIDMDTILDEVNKAKAPGTKNGEHWWQGNITRETAADLRLLGFRVLQLCFCDDCVCVPVHRVLQGNEPHGSKLCCTRSTDNNNNEDRN